MEKVTGKGLPARTARQWFTQSLHSKEGAVSAGYPGEVPTGSF